MKGDFSRMTFAPDNDFLRVMLQQGRVILDADWNEQTAILLHYLQTLAKDIMGQYAIVPHDFSAFAREDRDERNVDGWGFQVLDDLTITEGRAYVDGVLIENRADTPMTQQPYLPDFDPGAFSPPYLVYLDVWEWAISHHQVPGIREIALGADGPDTALRSRVVWQARIYDGDLPQTWFEMEPAKLRNQLYLSWPMLVAKFWQPADRGLLRATLDTPEGGYAARPSIIAPDVRYRGLENQLYRIEIHDGGTSDEAATFKWSRENGAVVLPVSELLSPDTGAGKDTTILKLRSLPYDERVSIQPGDWVEVSDDVYTLRGTPDALQRVLEVDRDDLTITLEGSPGSGVAQRPLNHPIVRRWDHQPKPNQPLHNGALPIRAKQPIHLEDGLYIRFEEGNHRYRAGDYWLIPARALSGTIEWPIDANNQPAALPPHGTRHHYAPLALVPEDGAFVDLRRKMVFPSVDDFAQLRGPGQ